MVKYVTIELRRDGESNSDPKTYKDAGKREFEIQCKLKLAFVTRLEILLRSKGPKILQELLSNSGELLIHRPTKLLKHSKRFQKIPKRFQKIPKDIKRSQKIPKDSKIY